MSRKPYGIYNGKIMNWNSTFIFTGMLFISAISMIIGCTPRQPETTMNEDKTNFAPTIEVVEDIQGLTDKIAFVEQRSQPNYRIAQFDPETQEISTLFQIPKGAWIYQLDVSADGQQVALAYSAPPEGDQNLLDRSGIYILDLTQPDAQPQRLIGGQQVDLYYTYPAWTSDGLFIYYEVSSREDSNHFIERFNIKSGEIIRIAENAILPQPSPDGKSLTYFQLQAETDTRTLMLSDADGGDIQQIIPGYAYYDLDCPVFSADGNAIYFTVLEDPLASVHWFDQLLGTQVAFAHDRHDLPADWWQTLISDIQPKQITTQSIITNCGQFTSDGKHFGFASNEGFYVISSNETEAHLILKSRAIPTFDWMS